MSTETLTLNTKAAKPALSLADELHAAGERLEAAGDREGHARVHALSMGLVDLRQRLKDAERCLKRPEEVAFVQRLKAELFESPSAK
ncbi:MAG TPA: hypothetical protein VGV09_02465 [Steroidobacteraceae bacterium]|nr:hypothetical protein [Steroidobacteraceae bacterium]